MEHGLRFHFAATPLRIDIARLGFVQSPAVRIGQAFRHATGPQRKDKDDRAAAMTRLRVSIGEETFGAELLGDIAPRTCACFLALLPWSQHLIHARWSGEACWIPLGGTDIGVGLENPTRHPRPGEFVFYPGGISETEILLAYGVVGFASKAGPLAGTPFLRIDDRAIDRLAEIGREILWTGAREIRFD